MPHPLPAVACPPQVCGVLAPGTLRALLQRYTPDDDCPDPVPQSLFARLDAAEQMKGGARRAGKGAAKATVAAPAPAYEPVSAEDVGTAWLEEEGFPLDDDGLEAAEHPARALLGEGAEAPEGAGGDCRFQLLRDEWGV